MSHARQDHGISERRACDLVNQPGGTQRYQPTQRDDEDALTRAILALASQYAAMVIAAYGVVAGSGLAGEQGRVERIWRREGLKVPQKQKPRGRLWLNDGSADGCGRSGTSLPVAKLQNPP